MSALFQMKCCGTIWLGKGVILSNELDCEPDVLRAHEENKFFSFTGGGSNLIFIIYWEQNLWNPRTGMLARSTTIWQSSGQTRCHRWQEIWLCFMPSPSETQFPPLALDSASENEIGKRGPATSCQSQTLSSSNKIGKDWRQSVQRSLSMLASNVTSPSLFNSETNSLV